MKKVRFMLSAEKLSIQVRRNNLQIVWIILKSNSSDDSGRESQTDVEGWGEIKKLQAFRQKVLLVQQKTISYSHGNLESESSRQTTLHVII